MIILSKVDFPAPGFTDNTNKFTRANLHIDALERRIRAAVEYTFNTSRSSMMGWDGLSGILFCHCEEGFNPTTLAPGASSGEQSRSIRKDIQVIARRLCRTAATATASPLRSSQ
ncbi:MAG: hypothetical protein MZV70_17910 [Desulfobacterales bacterium]|nr:hypothetical protein [Desulfobacterales bacterium]